MTASCDVPCRSGPRPSVAGCSPTSVTGLPSTATIRSSGRSPAAAAGESAATSTTSTPDAWPSSRASRGGNGRDPPPMPRYARRKRPSLISAPTIARVVSLTGTARPRPTPATAVLIPTTRAVPSASAPARAAGLSAASVWITLSTTRPARVGSDRPSAETTPADTDASKPRGLPTATTSWPTRSSEHRRARPARASRRRRAERRGPTDRVRADHLGVVRGSVDERRAHTPGTLDNVRGRDEEPVHRDHDGAATAAVAAQMRNRGQKPLAR